MKWLSCILATMFFACNTKPDDGCVADNQAFPGAGWNLMWKEEFDGGLQQWNTWNGGAFNNELQNYKAANVEVKGGQLIITAKKETSAGTTNPTDATQKTFNYTSGRIESKQLFSADAQTPELLLQARMKLPAGYGMWPAFWTYGDPWPTQGEIDALEARGEEPTKYQTNYFFGTEPGNNLVRGGEGFMQTTTDLTKCFHTYSLRWTKDSLVSYFDGVLVESKRSGGYIPELFGTKQKITLNLAVGGNFFNNFDSTKVQPGVLYVDWVRVYRK